MNTDEFGGVAVDDQDEFGGVLVADEFGGKPVETQYSYRPTDSQIQAELARFRQVNSPEEQAKHEARVEELRGESPELKSAAERSRLALAASEASDNPQADILRPQTLKERIAQGPLGTFTGLGRGYERELQQKHGAGPNVLPQDIAGKAFEFSTPPPPIREAVTKATDIAFEVDPSLRALPESVKGAAQGAHDIALQVPFAAGAVGMGKNIGRTLLAIFTGDYVWSLPEQKAEFDKAMEAGDTRTAARIATSAIAGGALLGTGIGHEAGSVRAAIAGKRAGLTKSVEALKEVTGETTKSEPASSSVVVPEVDFTKQSTTEVPSAIQKSTAAESVLREERPEVELQRVEPPRTEAVQGEVAPAIPAEAPRAEAAVVEAQTQSPILEVPNFPNLNYEGEAMLREAAKGEPSESKIDFTEHWRQLTPVQRQELDARGWKAVSDRNNRVLIGVKQSAKSELLKRAVLAKQAAKAEPTLPQSGTPVSAEQPVSMGGLNPATEQPKAQLAQLTDAIKTLANTDKPSPAKAFDLGESLSKAKDRVTGAIEGLKVAGSYLKTKLDGKPVVTDWKRALGDRHLALSESAVNARKFVKQAMKDVPDPKLQEAISNWIDTGGDDALLARAAAETKGRYKEGYERARKLTPEERTVAENLKNYFESRFAEAQEAGILEDGIENYIHRIYETESPWKKGVLAELRSGLFTGKPALAKQRVFEYDFEAEKSGLKPIKSFIKRVAAYDLALNKAIADRQAVKAMMEIKMADGRPMIDVGGGGTVIKGDPVEIMPGVEYAPTEATLINRSQKRISEDATENRGDYKPYDHPSLRKWKWVAKDSEGKPIFVQGDVLVHPDALRQIEALLGRSRIRQHPVGRALLDVSSTVKQTMLDLSGFHPVQIGVHGMEHRTFKPVTEIDFTNPDVRGLIRGGAVVGETTGYQHFSEGLSGSSLTKHIPVLGERLQAYQSWLFEDYIPRLKVAMGLHALERNQSRFPKLSKEELYQLTADQMNAAFGEQNYEMLGRSKTVQDALRLALLAPDFLEARSRFVAQAVTKYGREQTSALMLGAATMYITARLMNRILDDEYHFEPKNAFNIVHNGKSYGLRTIQGDLIHLVTDPGKFTNHRLNPIYGKPALEFATGRDYFGRKRDIGDKLKDIATTPLPISVRGLISGREQSLLESFLNSFGFVTKRDSPSSAIGQLANEWKKENKVSTEPGEFIYDAEKDPYRNIRLAAEYYNVADVRSEIDKAISAGLTKQKIRQHFALSAQHRFTGSIKNERKFIDSLTTDQKKLYQDAVNERQKIKATVDAALK